MHHSAAFLFSHHFILSLSRAVHEGWADKESKYLGRWRPRWLVLFRDPEKVPKLVALLAESFNPHVRYGVCLALGFACAGSGDNDAMALQLRLGKATETEQTPCSGRLLSGPLPQREAL